MDEVFGSENFVSQVTYNKTTGATTVMLPGTSDYLLWYAKSKQNAKYRSLFTVKVIGGEGRGEVRPKCSCRTGRDALCRRRRRASPGSFPKVLASIASTIS